MTIKLATRADGRLMTHAVRYWTYTKYPYGNAWEGNFPATIYLVGCKPAWSTFLCCSDEPNKKVIYHRGACSIIAPASEYIYSWDRRALCSWTDSRFCGDLEYPPDPGNVADGGESTLDLCLTIGSPAGLKGPLMESYIYNELTYYNFQGFVEPDNYLDGTECKPKTYNTVGTFGPYEDGIMSGGSAGPWQRGPVTIDVDGHVTFGQSFMFPASPAWGYLIDYSGEADLSLDPDSDLPVGSVEIEVFAIRVHNDYQWYWINRFCEDDTPECGAPCECSSGTISITVSVTEDESCS